MSDVRAAAAASPVFVLALWAAGHFCWGVVAVSAHRDRVQALADRLVLFCPVPFRIVEVASDDDDVIVAALVALPSPRGHMSDSEFDDLFAGAVSPVLSS